MKKIYICVLLILTSIMASCSSLTPQEENANGSGKINNTSTNAPNIEFNKDTKPQLPKFNPSSEELAQMESLTTTTSSTNTVNLQNPASKNCVDAGGKVEIRKQVQGGEYGVCVFPDARECEEWAILRGNCPKSGRNISIYKTEAQKYCVITGGVIHVSKNPMICELPEGLGSCSVDEYYQKGVNCVSTEASK